MAPDTNEFERVEKTPADALITDGERKIVFVALRTLIKVTVPLLPKFALVAGPALALLLAAAQHWSGKAETDHKIAVGYETLAPASREQAEEIAELKKAVAQLADSVALQARLALASRPGFDDKGKPEAPAAKKQRGRARPAAPPADPTIVKRVQEDAAKNQALKARLVVEKPAAPVVPKELPAEVPKPQAAPAPVVQKIPGQEWPPPVPNPPDAAKP